MNASVSALQVVHTTESNKRAQAYRDAIRKEREAEANSIIAAWETGHAFRAYDDPVTEISALTGMGEAYIYKRMRLAGAFTRAKLAGAIERSGATHFTAFYSWAFGEGSHQSNQMFKHRNVHVPVMHWQYFEAISIDVSEAMKAFLEVIPPAELHALLKKYVPGDLQVPGCCTSLSVTDRMSVARLRAYGHAVRCLHASVCAFMRRQLRGRLFRARALPVPYSSAIIGEGTAA